MLGLNRLLVRVSNAAGNGTSVCFYLLTTDGAVIRPSGPTI